MATKEKNTNKYADLTDMTEAYDNRFLIRISTVLDTEPAALGAAENAKIEQSLQKVSDLIDSYIMGQVATPMVDPPDFFVTKTVRMAAAELVRWKGYEKDSSDHEIVKEGRLCEKFFEDVQKGNIKLAPSDSSGNTSPALQIKSLAPVPIFPETLLDQY